MWEITLLCESIIVKKKEMNWFTNGQLRRQPSSPQEELRTTIASRQQV